MCITCGCSDDAHVTMTNPETGTVQTLSHLTHEHTHVLPDGQVVIHTHPTHDQSHHHPLDSSSQSAQDDSQGNTQDTDQGKEQDSSHSHSHSLEVSTSTLSHAQVHSTTLSLEQNILAKNDQIAAQNRGWLKGRKTLALNLVSSPGSGKTTLLTRTIHDLKSEFPIHVIEGDQATAQDAERIRQTGCQVVQINTGTGCHLEAAMVERGLEELNPPLNSVVMIENVGNLVCPALFDLGEYAKVVILSVTEGEDKPIKYPHMFRASQVMILTKTDLLPYVQFDCDRCLDYAYQVNPHLKVFQLSATTGTGLDRWYDWLRSLRTRE